MFRVLARNVCSNWVGFIAHGVITFFLTPYILDALGAGQYGIWILITSLTGYYGFLTMGIGAGTTQQLTKAIAEGNAQRVNQLASTAVLALSGCGLAIWIAALVMSFCVPQIFSVPDELMRESQLCVLIMGAATGFQFSLFAFSVVFTAKQRYDLSNSIGIATRVMSAAAIVLALRQGGGLVALCAVGATAESIGSVIRCIVARRLIPTLRISPFLVDRSSLTQLASLSVWNALISGGHNLIATSGILIIGALISDAAIAPYAMALSLVQMLTRPLYSAAIVFYPASAELFAKADVGRLRKVYLSGAKLMMLLGVAAGVPGILWSRDFYSLWIPEQLAEWTQYTAVETLFLVLIAAEVIGAPTLIGHQIVLGAHRIKLLVGLTWAEGMLAISLSSVLAATYGLLGIAVATAVASIITRAVAYPLLLDKMLDIWGREFARQVLVRPILAAGILLLVLQKLHNNSGTIDSWSQFFVSASAAGVVALMVCVAVGLTAQERDLLVTRPLLRLLQYLGIEPSNDATETDVAS